MIGGKGKGKASGTSSGGGGGAVAKGSKQSGVDGATGAAAASSMILANEGPGRRSARSDEAVEASAQPRLVFGLSARTNKAKHDEYAAERRSASPANLDTNYSQSEELSSKTNKQLGGSKSNEEIASNKSVVAQSTPISIESPAQPPINKKMNEASVLKNRKDSQDSKREINLQVAPATTENVNAEETKKLRSDSPKRISTGTPSRRKSLNGTVASDNSSPEIAKAPVEKAKPQQAKMQFTVPPPPQVFTHSTTKSSVVGYAKSRIYDKPTARQLQQQHQHQQQMLNSFISPLTGGSSLSNHSNSPLDSSAPIPESILSGFKPPKQVNVSKAREKWEGGEPFAKSKSRQRLAAQAGKISRLYGSWSMTDVVATQQLQLQQALAQASSPIRSNVEQSDPSVKILTRGSVLERVQLFERAPTICSSSSSSSSGSSGDSSNNSLADEDELNSVTEFTKHEPQSTEGLNQTAIRAGNKSPPTSVTDERWQTTNEKVNKSTQNQFGTIKQAIYKARVSNIQTSAGQNNDLPQLTPLSISLPMANNASPSATPTTTTPQSPKSQTISLSNEPAANGQRRFSLRRRSSTSSATTSNSNSTSNLIPKFYHPNGKPNTYEIELQKKNIVACFDKFTDRKALLAPPAYKRHFHLIALTCGFTEYFKEPLYRYVKHQMTQSNLLHNNSVGLQSSMRKQSGVGPMMVNSQTNGNQTKSTTMSQRKSSISLPQNPSNPSSVAPNNPQPPRSPLTKAASIDNSTMEKIQNQTYITCDQFLICWRQIISSSFDLPARFIHLLTLGQRQYLLPEDFVPLIQSIIDDHPGLKFLRAAPDFHMRYIQTVIARIYYCINKSWTGKISVNELRKSNLLAVLQVLSQEEDINQITDYFSYEHFYVIYCKFWSLDQDHDLLISKEDLAKHNDASISSRIIDRIFMGIVSKQIQLTGKMSYTDFVWFLIAEEDKKHPRSIEYWFRLMDLDGDGYISMFEMEYFYYEQMKRLELMNIEALPFIDSACQILDLVNPKEKNKISLSDLKRTKLATIFFDTFINLEKYLEHESREFVSSRDIIQDGVVISDWDHYASEEYESLVTEETSV